MKKIKFSALFFILFSLVVLVACTADNESQNEIKSQVTLKSNTSDFLKKYYKSTYNLGVSIVTGDGLNKYRVTEVKVDNIARGYIATDFTTESELFFIDVDRRNAIVESVDLKTNETYRADVSDNKLFLSGGLDYIKIIHAVNVGNVTPYFFIDIHFGSFWGDDVDCPGGPISSNNLKKNFIGFSETGTAIYDCFRTDCRVHKSRFFLSFGSGQPAGDVQTSCP